MQKNLYLNQKFTKFINNENFEFDRSKILKILNSNLLEDAYKTISKWQKYQPTPLESLNKLSKQLGLKNIFYKEVSSYFNGPMAYIFLVIFAIVNSFFFTNIFFVVYLFSNLFNNLYFLRIIFLRIGPK